MTDKIEQYMAKCKAYENDKENYSLYVHGYLLIWLHQQRQAGKLSKGTSKHLLIINTYSTGQDVEMAR